MKKIILLAVIMFSAICSAQDNAKALSYTSVVKLDSITGQADLYNVARSWFAEKYRSANDMIQFDDKDAGKIIGKGYIPFHSKVFVGSAGTEGSITYTITVEVKQGRYKYNITNFIHKGKTFSFGEITTDVECPNKIQTQGWSNKVWNDIKAQIQPEAQKLIQSLTAYMATRKSTQEEKW